jgi:hypothetical protein
LKENLHFLKLGLLLLYLQIIRKLKDITANISNNIKDLKSYNRLNLLRKLL